MEQVNKTLSPAAIAVASLQAAPDAREGWAVFNALRHPVFLKACALLALASFFSGVFNYVYDAKIAPAAVRDCLNATYMIILILGGFKIIGRLSPKIIAVVIANSATYIIFNALFINDKPMLLFNGITANWGLYYLAMTEHDAMGEFGLRRASIGGDFTLSLITSVCVFFFLVHSMTLYGMHLKFDALNIAIGTLSSITMHTSIFGVMFLVWKRLAREGLSKIGVMLVLFCLMVCIQTPVCFEVYFVRHIPLYQVVLGPGVFAVFMPMFMAFTFQKFKSVIPCMFVVLTIMALLFAAGIT